jgi:hypothetical protein
MRSPDPALPEGEGRELNPRTLPSGVNVSCHEVNNAESGPSDANNQNENVSGTHIRPFRSQIGRTSVPGMVGGASSTRNQSSDECGRLILGYCMRGQSVIAPTVGGIIRIESGTDAVIGEAFGVPFVWGLFRRSSINHIYEITRCSARSVRKFGLCEWTHYCEPRTY